MCLGGEFQNVALAHLHQQLGHLQLYIAAPVHCGVDHARVPLEDLLHTHGETVPFAEPRRRTRCDPQLDGFLSSLKLHCDLILDELPYDVRRIICLENQHRCRCSRFAGEPLEPVPNPLEHRLEDLGQLVPHDLPGKPGRLLGPALPVLAASSL